MEHVPKLLHHLDEMNYFQKFHVYDQESNHSFRQQPGRYICDQNLNFLIHKQYNPQV